MSWSGRMAIPNVREWSEGPPKCPGVDGRTSWIFESGREAFRMSWSGRMAIPNV